MSQVDLRKRLNIEILRNAHITTYPFTDYFKGFEKVEAIQRIFGSNTETVLKSLKVEFGSGRGYMRVLDDGHLFVSADYLRNGNTVDIYLDIIHELVHIKQLIDGKTLREHNFAYVDRPTEIEAYSLAVQEAKRLGMDNAQILDYLRTERMSDEELARLYQAVKILLSKPSLFT